MKIAALAAIAACLPMSAVAQTQCGPTSGIYEALTNKHGETRAAAGIEPSGLLVELWANPETGTWTLFYTRPDGLSCAVSSGQGFQAYAPEPNL